jgi:uncharacterized membrane protein YhaH (DUF805 family)
MSTVPAPPVTAEHPLDRPDYGVGPVAAVKRFYRNYAVFSGRASRSEYWWANLAYAVAVVVLATLGNLAGTAGATVDSDGATRLGPLAIPFVVLMAVVGLGSALPLFAIAFRRLHDANFSGYFFLLSFLPFGSLVLVVLTILPANPLGARFDKRR